VAVSPPVITLRPFAADDSDEILTWFTNLAELRLFAGSAAVWPLTSGDLESYAREPGVASFVAATAQAPVAGHVGVVDEGSGVFRLARIAIAPRLRGRGLAVPLVEAALGEAVWLGARSAALHVVPGNKPALRAYTRVGFVAGEPHPQHPEYVRMVLDLTNRHGAT
jgi:GNAT superfamily N-acetyltransferase